MEAIASILLLSILLVIINTMIQTSRGVTAKSMQDAGQLQEELFNLATLESNELDPDSGTITFFIQLPEDNLITSEHYILIYRSKHTDIIFPPQADILAFFPDSD
jgi:type II secretory pathway pseudopilin PulG